MMRHFIGSDVPPNFGSLVNSFGSEYFIPYDRFIYCSTCSSLKQLLHTKNFNCGDCNKGISRFYHLSIRYQLDIITAWPVYLTVNQLIKNQRFKLNNVIIGVPDFFPRHPRSLDDLPKWKANELLSFLLFYLLPLLRFIINDQQFYHLINLVFGMEYLLDNKLEKENLNQVNFLFKDFVQDMEHFYGEDSMLSGVQIQSTNDLKINGHLRELNCFAFEDLNRQITSFLKAKNLVGAQLINSFNVSKIYHSSIDDYSQNQSEVFPWKKSFFKELTFGKNLGKELISQKIINNIKTNFVGLFSNFKITDFVRFKNTSYSSIYYKTVKNLDYCIEYDGKFGLINYFCYTYRNN
ncbi:unnamed protein product [Brachionus calyciflorus]|uniref:Uncharacterized protein n=1 Tax=Brachionus calyciflorus TaxID=104777 RepID=A0A814LDE1_9BILA|nr:unnamed protein product [Brachionus calyciflorus]